jgi:putative ABC transport system substrate-binding protein
VLPSGRDGSKSSGGTRRASAPARRDKQRRGRQAAPLVDNIMKGVDLAEIPVEGNTKIKFAINLKTAKTLGLTIAPEVLFQADKVIR